jgi:hypothetical protein
MRCYTKQQPCYCGIDFPARTLDVGILPQEGELLVHRPVQARPEALRKVLPPSRDGLVSAVECLCTWDGLADLCAPAGLPVVLGPALSRQAIPGGQATNERSAAHPIAVLLRGGRLPQASGSPAAMRATRARWRRRRPCRCQRAARLTHLPPTTRPDQRPEMGQPSASTATREGVAERCRAPAGHTRRAVALALLGHDDHLRRDRA